MIPMNYNKIKRHVFFLSWQIFGCMYLLNKMTCYLLMTVKLLNSELLVNMYIFIYQTFSSGSCRL